MSLRSASRRLRHLAHGLSQQYSHSHAAALLAKATSQTSASGADVNRILSRHWPSLFRSLSTSFQPSRLYPKQQRLPSETYAFWGLVATNVAAVLWNKQEDPHIRQLSLQHLRTSVEAILDGRYHTLITSIFSHFSGIHCAVNLLMLVFSRSTLQLTAAEVTTCLLLQFGVGCKCECKCY